MASLMPVYAALLLGASALWTTAWARMIRASGIPIWATACMAATAVCSAVGSAMPTSSRRRDDDAPGDEPRVLPGLEHPGEVVQRRVDVGAAHRLDQRRGHVVVLVAGAVVAHARERHRLLGVRQRDLHRARRARHPARYAVLRHSRGGLQ